MSAGDGSVQEHIQTRSRRCSQARFEAEPDGGLVLIGVAAEAACLRGRQGSGSRAGIDVHIHIEEPAGVRRNPLKTSW